MAKKGINRVMVMGNLGQDPKVSYMPGGDAVCNLSVATSETWKDKQTNETREETEWHNVVLFRRDAEIAGEYLAKGCKVAIDGKLRTRSWEKDGVKHYMTQVYCNDLHIITFKDGATVPPTRQQANQARPQGQPQARSGDVFDDDIPF